MKDINQIKEELKCFGRKHNACYRGIKAIRGNSLTELFQNISMYIHWCRSTNDKVKEFNRIFDNELIIENNILFCDCRELTSVIIPNSVTSIEGGAFRNCSELISIEIPDSVTSIGDYAFEGCTGLTSIEIPNSVTSIGNYTFEECSGLRSITIPDSVIAIGNYAFSFSGLILIIIPNSVTFTGDDTFFGCNKNLKTIRK